jgi:PST family polysaccharide transporter
VKPHSAAGALLWSFGSTALSKFGTMAIGIVLARLLGPSEFGAYAVALVALTVVLSFNELGVSLAIVRWPSDPKEIAGTVTTISVGFSVLVYLAGFIAAPAFAAAMGAPGATWTIRLLLVSIITDAVTTTPSALLERGFRQDKRAIADQVNVWLGSGVSIVLAVIGAGSLSLAVGRMTGSVVSAAILVAVSPLPLRFEFKRARVPELMRFGLPLAGASLVVIAAGNIDQLVVGHLLGAAALGAFALAINISSWPVTMFSQPMRNVAAAAFSRMRERPDERSGSFRAIIRVLTAAALPVCGFLGGSAVSIVHFVYGDRWDAAAPVLQWLAVVAATRIVFELVYDFLVVLGRSGRVLGIQLLWVAVLTPAVIVGAVTGGIGGAALAEAATAVVVVLPAYVILLARNGIRPSVVLGSIALPVAGGAAVALAGLLLSLAGVPPLVACIAGGLMTCAAIAALGWRERSSVREIRMVRATVTA